MWARKRQAFSLFVVAGIFFLFFGVPYLYLHREIPTCFDGKQNVHNGLKEDGVDCGGVCARVCDWQALPLKTIWQKVFPVRPGVYDIAAYMENPNFGKGIPHLRYAARLWGPGDEVLAEKKGEVFVGSNERFLVFAGGLYAGEVKPAKGAIIFEEHPEWIVAVVPERQFEIGDKSLASPTTRPRLSATLKNITNNVLHGIDVGAIVYDDQNTPIGVSSTRVDKLDAGKEERMFFTWNNPFVYSAGTESCDVPVDVVLALDRSGSMRSDQKDPPEPLSTAKDAAAEFVSRLSRRDQAGYLSFATDVSRPVDQSLTDRFDRVESVIQSTRIGSDGIQFTNIGAALRVASDELTSIRHNDDSDRVIVLLTDGVPTRPESKDDPDYPSKFALDSADAAKKAGITIFTIGLGSDLNSQLLQGIAADPAHYYPSPTKEELSRVYKDISTAICKKNPSVIEIIPRVNPYQ